MNKYITYFLSVLLAVFLGCLGTYYYITNNPEAVVTSINKVEREVTVNENGISDGIENIYDAVLVVENYKRGTLVGIGSGFIYSDEGYIITNHHVVAGSTELKVILMNGNTVNAALIGSDEYADIAIIKIDKNLVPSVAKIGSSEKTKVGDTVFAIGSPVSSKYSGTVTRGILSGKNRMVEVSVKSTSDWIMNVMQTDAAINPGNSGGPLCNVSGEVIGVNSMKLVQDSIEGIGFSIPIEDALLYANKIVNHVEIKRAYLGVSMADLSVSKYYLNSVGVDIDEDITSGVIVIEVGKDSPAYKAGLKKGDVIVKIGDYDVKTAAELKYYLYKYEPKTKINVNVIRDGDTKTFNVELGES